jgi:hypothetical protein
MNAIHKLVVVLPFDNYKRGDYILDQDAVEKYMHSSHVRRVKLLEDERLMLQAKEDSKNFIEAQIVEELDEKPIIKLKSVYEKK